MAGIIAGIVIAVVLMTLGLIRANAQEKQDKAKGVTARFSGLALSRTHLIVGAKRYPLAGVTARVEDAGQLSRRITATRIVATGVFALAWRKRQDDRSVFLTIEGPGVAVVREIKVKNAPNAPGAARVFAAKVNAAAGALGPAQAPAVAAGGGGSGWAARGVGQAAR